MLKGKAPTKTRITALIDSASTLTPNPTAMASSSSATAEIDSGLRVVAGPGAVPQNASSEPLSCVISLLRDVCRPYTCGHCGGENKQRLLTGTLTDSKSESDGDAPPIAVFEYDNTPDCCAVMLFRLGGIAVAKGYTHCELRDYSCVDNDGYVPLYGGPISDMDLVPDRA